MASADDPHSQRYFTDARDHWWHDDYVGLLATRLRVRDARAILDVGTGQGHFARVWARHFAPGFALTGVDREQRSLDVAKTRCADFAAHHAIDGTFTFVCSPAETLPFADGQFDMVMCQTLLIHLLDPSVAFAEMVRVTKPGGVVLAVEPNNLAGLGRLAVHGPECDLALLLRAAAFVARCTRGKHALGLGWNHFGALLPTLFHALQEVVYFNNDRPWVMAPPYARPQEQAALADLRRDIEASVFGWERDEARRYYLAGGGGAEEFEKDYNVMLDEQARELRACNAGFWHELTAFAGLIAAGRKPR